MRFSFLLLLFLSPLVSFAQEFKTACINDPDGFTNVRTAPGASSAIAGKLLKDDLFNCKPAGGDWWKISAYQLEGYIHRSRVQLFDTLPDNVKKGFFQRGFARYENIAKRNSDLWDEYEKNGKKWKNPEDGQAHDKARRELEDMYERTFLPLLVVFPGYFCKTADTAALRQLFNAMLEDTGSADESRDFAVGDCYICQPDAVLKVLGTYKGRSRSYVFGAVEYGLMNNLDENKPEYKRLSQRLKNAEKSAH